MKKTQPFHLAIPVNDLLETKAFYLETIQCTEGRSSDKWLDLDFFGHQLVLHIAESQRTVNQNPVDGHDVPIPHFGVVLLQEDWDSMSDRLKRDNVKFVIEPYVRFKGEAGEQSTMFFLDPSGNALEFKAFKNMDQLFAK